MNNKLEVVLKNSDTYLTLDNSLQDIIVEEEVKLSQFCACQLVLVRAFALVIEET